MKVHQKNKLDGAFIIESISTPNATIVYRDQAYYLIMLEPDRVGACLFNDWGAKSALAMFDDPDLRIVDFNTVGE